MSARLIFRISLCLAWLTAAAAGVAVALNYEKAPGIDGETPLHWPDATSIRLEPDRDTLVMFVHPRCPCSRASLEELNRLLASAPNSVVAHVCFLKPDSFSNDWTRTDLWRSAERMPGVRVQADVDGALAKRFGAETSGFLVLYEPKGRLLFKGGITGGRGHMGNNASEETLRRLLTEKTSELHQTPVYGCGLSCPASSQNETLR